MGTSALERVLGQQPVSALDAVLGDPDALAKWHEAYKSGTLQRRITAANATDPERYELDKAPSYTDRLGSMAERAASVIPGGSAVMTAERMAFTGEPRAEAAEHVAEGAEEAAQNAPGVTIPEAIPLIGGSRITLADAPTALVTGRALSRALPGLSVPKQGALYTGALAATDPRDQSLGERAVRTGVSAALGAAIPKTFELAGRATKALTGKLPETQLSGMQADRAASAAKLFRNALAEGEGKAVPRAVVDFLAEPDIAEIVDQLKSTRPYADTPEASPEMLDAVYKVLSDRSKTVGKSLLTNPKNLGRVEAQDIRMAKDAALNALETPGAPTPFPGDAGGRPPFMPSYRGAVEDFAKRSADMDAFTKGYDALRIGAAERPVAGKNLLSKTPTGMAADIQKLTPEQQQLAQQGLQAFLTQELKHHPFTSGRRALLQATPIARKLAGDLDPMQGTRDVLQTAGTAEALDPNKKNDLIYQLLFGLLHAVPNVGGGSGFQP